MIVLAFVGLLLFIGFIALVTGPSTTQIETTHIHMHQAPHQYERNDRAAAQERGYSYPPPAEQPAQVTVNNRRGRQARQREGWRETPQQPQPPEYGKHRRVAVPRVVQYAQPEYDERWENEDWGTPDYSDRTTWGRRPVLAPLVDPATGELVQQQEQAPATTQPAQETPAQAARETNSAVRRGHSDMSLDMASTQRWELHPKGTPTTGRNTEPGAPRRVPPLELPDSDRLNYRK